MNNRTDWTFETRSDIVIVGQDPEMADVTNPHGHIHGLLWFVVASNSFGDTRELAVVSSSRQPGHIHCVGGSDPKASAERLAAALNARMAAGKLPLAFSLWPAGRAIYGSDAYVLYGQADEVALEAREAADEAFGY